MPGDWDMHPEDAEVARQQIEAAKNPALRLPPKPASPFEHRYPEDDGFRKKAQWDPLALIHEMMLAEVHVLNRAWLDIPSGYILCHHDRLHLELKSNDVWSDLKIQTTFHVLGPGDMCAATVPRTQFGPK